MLGKMGIVRSREEAAGVAAVLDAAALTYVAATVSAVATLLYYGLLIFGGGRRE
jgi:Zn-dependent membrane protease YugP